MLSSQIIDNVQTNRKSKEYHCPNGNSKIFSLWITDDMSSIERKNLIADLKMMTKNKIISPAFSEHIANNIMGEN
jgi:hypothetical protein